VVEQRTAKEDGNSARTSEKPNLHQQKNGWTSHSAKAEPVSIRCRRVHPPPMREWGPKRASFAMGISPAQR
jgi:hypothetical protein